MPHLDSEHLLLLALGEQLLGPADLDHLGQCAACQGDYEALTSVAALGRGGRAVRQLPPPPTSVWNRIVAETGVALATVDAAPEVVSVPLPVAVDSKPVLDLRRRRWARSMALATAAAVLGVVGTIGASHVAQRLDQPEVTAQAALTAFGTTPVTAHGEARVLLTADGTRLHIHLADLPASGGFYEVWLIDPSTLQMISLGVIGSESDVLLPLPSTVDLKTYSLVDVSAEPLDGNPAHSGASLLRGTLTV